MGGNFSRFWKILDLWNVGLSLAEASADSTFVVTEHPKTGGMVTTETVGEQLVYEVENPWEYLTPGPRIAKYFASRAAIAEKFLPGQEIFGNSFCSICRATFFSPNPGVALTQRAQPTVPEAASALLGGRSDRARS